MKHLFRLIRLESLIALGTLVMLITDGVGVAPAFAAPNPRSHCKGAGPLSGDDYCGCTWGAVLINGKPVTGAQIGLSFGSAITTTVTTFDDEETYPYFSLHADVLGAKYGDLATVAATYLGQTLTRTIRLVPDSEGEQIVNFAFPHWGSWQKYADAPAVRALAFHTDTLWVGLANGLMSWNLGSGISTTHSTGLTSQQVQALAVAPNGDVWVGTAAGLSRYDGLNWTPQATGLGSSNIRAIAISPQNVVWVVAYDAAAGGLSKFDGATWQPQPDVNGANPNRYTAVAVDGAGNVWVGTDGYGAVRWSGTLSQTFTTQHGLSSNEINAIGVETGAVWFATQSYVNTNGAFGGVARYDVASGQWLSYTQLHGLAANDVTAVVADASGRTWFGTPNGISVFDGLNWWTYGAGSGLGATAVRALALGSAGELWAGAGNEASRFITATPGGAPFINTFSVTPSISHRMANQHIYLQATATDGDTSGKDVVSYDWQSSLDGSLGSEATFALRSLKLQAGTHTLSVRALDDEGVWSSVMTTTLVVAQPRQMFLPFLQR